MTDARLAELEAVVQSLVNDMKVLKATVRRLAGKAHREHRLSKTNRKLIEPPPDGFPRLLPLSKVQKILLCSRNKIYQLYQDDQLQLVKFGGQIRVTDASLRAMLNGGLPPARGRKVAP